MPPKKPRSFDVRTFLEAPGLGRSIATYAKGAAIFSQGQPGDSVLFLRKGGIQLSVLSDSGKEAIVGVVNAGDFFGEGALAGHPVRLETATATKASEAIVVHRRQMIDLLHSEPAFSDRFISHVLMRNARLESDLVDQLFNSSEKRLARTLLLLARYGNVAGSAPPHQVLPHVAQETLAEMVGTTRSRVNLFLNKFRKLGFIEYDATTLTVHPSLLTVIVHR